MSDPNRLTSVTFTTQAVAMLLYNKNARIDESKFVFGDGEAKNYDMELVTGIEMDGYESVLNPEHSDDIDDMQVKEQDSTVRKMEMDHDRAVRLIEAFRTLRRGHDTDCHRFLAMVEGWDEAKYGTLNVGNGLLQEASHVESGMPYTVLSLEDAGNEVLHISRTHSAIGAEQGRLLSVMGKGSALTFMGYDDTKELYGFNNTAYLVRAYDPAVAAQYPNTIVPEVEAQPSSAYMGHPEHQAGR